MEHLTKTTKSMIECLMIVSLVPSGRVAWLSPVMTWYEGIHSAVSGKQIKHDGQHESTEGA